ncbi:MAG: tetratricopeptide repeat protein [Planctomycetota bacterium]
MIAFVALLLALARDAVAPLRELAELGLAAELLAEYADDVAPGGELAAHAEAVALVARAQFDTGDETGARRRLHAFGDQDARAVTLELARLDLDTDRLDDAWKRLIREDGRGPRATDDATAWLLLGRVAHRRGEHERARPLLERALELAPRGPEASAAWHMLGVGARGRRDAAAARACFERAADLRRWHDLFRARRLQVRAAPNDPLPRLGLGLLWLEADEPARARAEFVRLTRDHPAFTRGWLYLGEAERQLLREEAALAAFGRALALDGDLALARAQRGALHAAAARWPEAVRDLEHFATLPEASQPGFAIAFWHLARALDALGRADEAERAFRRYRALGGERAR